MKSMHLKLIFAIALSLLSLGLQAQSKPPLPQDKVLKLFEKTADKTSPQRLVAELDLASLKQLPQQLSPHTHLGLKNR
ncbi:MAG: hypothetical protein EBQ68_08000 [Betaproteobacteria bacterium]|nr:hypothetical protein [Betaproteobacteria bacterium]